MNSSILKKATKLINKNSLNNLINNFTKSQSSAASQGQLITEINDKNGFATITFNRPPMNSFNLEFVKELSKTLDELEHNKCRGLILTSSSPVAYCAGFDLKEMYKPDESRFTELIATYVDCYIKLYSSLYPTATTITGHSIAAGTFLAINCEYRVMLPNFKIGMNEITMGVTLPKCALHVMSNILTPRNAEKALTLGSLFTTEEAKQIGLIDDIAKDKEEGIAKCVTFLESFKKIPYETRGITKQIIRRKGIELMVKNKDKDVETFVKHFMHPKSQKGIEMILTSGKK